MTCSSVTAKAQIPRIESILSALASGVPGALAAYDYAVKHYGQKTLKELILPAAAIAEQGFEVDQHFVNRVKAEEKYLNQFASFARGLFQTGRHSVSVSAILFDNPIWPLLIATSAGRGLTGFITDHSVRLWKTG